MFVKHRKSIYDRAQTKYFYIAFCTFFFCEKKCLNSNKNETKIVVEVSDGPRRVLPCSVDSRVHGKIPWEAKKYLLQKVPTLFSN